MESQPSPNDSAASQATENTPLLPTAADGRPKGARSVTFSPNPVSRTIELDPDRAPYTNPRHGLSGAPPGSATVGLAGPPVFAALNSRLRRRNSHSAVPTAPLHMAGPKIGPQRSTKKTEKLKLLPNPELDEEVPDEESGRDVYSQYTRIKDPNARRDAARLGKADRDRLPRVTAYCTANRYDMEALQRFLKGRGKARGANPKRIDECLYTPYNYKAKTTPPPPPPQSRPDPVRTYERRHSTGGESIEEAQQRRETLIDVHPDGPGDGYADSARVDTGNLHTDELLGPSLVEDDRPIADSIPDFDVTVHTPEVFLFDYGVVVIWGMSESQEKRFLKDIAKFEQEKLAPDDVETEKFNFYYTREYQPRIYNDFITLRDKKNYMTKLSISHALAQSVKTSLFEELIASTVETCKDIPTHIALTGKISMSRSQINMQIGELFILRINIHLNGSVLDTPELFWVEPQLEPVYQAVRSYLEMDQRVGLLNERLDVIADLLAVLKDHLSHGHGEMLEWIVIILIAAEILVAGVNIIVDLYVGEF
ncbi:Sporulation protein-like protein [Hapsidospora chrysogenum ATCC 11550]|uniref:Sporulation protein-like protein n=1 Tax=Hapsidospora chrysogenum (strain ATCC 11550 / CBS 779.69 / DSM 880 / IAM 14645 / JCM 23072 / IMI 49137) TaxID=857340 RepID=A0A086THQ3_HAPC1|nr:Sporulation protein-like protein [Hapsidospora chrysogenum ATCC 11550]